MVEREEVIKKLKEYFGGRDEVVFAFLFGSQARGEARSASDWDIGVYLDRQTPQAKSELWQEVERIVGGEVDLVILNQAPATLSWRIVGQGEALVIKNRKVYLDFLLAVSEEADAFYRTSREYYEVFQRSASLAAGDRDRLRRILTFLEEEVGDYEKFRMLRWDDYQRDKTKKREVEHWIEHMVNAVVDAAKIILASERRVLPETYHDLVLALGSVPPFDRENLCEKIGEWVRLRNILAHEYLDYRWKNIAPFINETEVLWRAFIERTKDFLKGAESDLPT